eukprot:3818777-Rhodomonas_salina.3
MPMKARPRTLSSSCLPPPPPPPPPPPGCATSTGFRWSDDDAAACSLGTRDARADELCARAKSLLDHPAFGADGLVGRTGVQAAQSGTPRGEGHCPLPLCV